ncbi:DUF885 domain-containing protein [Streptosporangiaceae bacterium NEAU-GS5]|nr:DUF885 domain-containing protein [Streptosporangiaceae bacterium NEAU-GS5]
MTSVADMTLLDEFVSWYLDAHPVRAALLGAEGHDHTLGDFTEAGHIRRERAAEIWLERLEADTTCDEIDRGLAISHLRGSVASASWPEWRRDPGTYLNVIFGSMFTPFQQRLRPEAELVSAAISRLGEVPGMLAAARANLAPDLASDLLVGRAIDQGRTARRFLTETIPSTVEDESLRAELAKAAEPAAEACDAYVEFLETFEAGGSWRMGERLYTTLLREREMLDYGAAELHELGRTEWAKLDARMSEVSAALGHERWREAMDALMDDHAPTLEAMLTEYRAETERARVFARERGLVTFPEGEECLVEPSPEFQRPIIAVANYLAPPPLSTSRQGVFFVPYTPDGASEEQIRQRLRTNARAQMPSIAVHEAYPGHHWHLAVLSDNPSTLRKMFRTPYFVEGWALYVEKVMQEHGYYDTPWTELAHLDFRLFRAARIIVDTALHCGDMTIEQAEDFMATKASLTPGTARGEVGRYCAWPTQAPSYLTGALEIERIRADFGGDLRTFNDRIARSGGLPLGLARRALLDT